MYESVRNLLMNRDVWARQSVGRYLIQSAVQPFDTAKTTSFGSSRSVSYSIHREAQIDSYGLVVWTVQFLTRPSADGVQALLNKYVAKAREHCVSLRSKRVCARARADTGSKFSAD